MGFWKDMANDAYASLTLKDFISAASFGKNDYLAGVLQKNPEVLDKKDKASGMNALMTAIIHAPLDTISLLLENGASIREKDMYGENVLHLAVAWDQKDKLALLLARDDIASIINEKDADGITALHKCVLLAVADNEAVEYLLARGADPSLKDNKGRTALSIAKANGHTHAVALLEWWENKTKPAMAERPAAKRYSL